MYSPTPKTQLSGSRLQALWVATYGKQVTPLGDFYSCRVAADIFWSPVNGVGQLSIKAKAFSYRSITRMKDNVINTTLNMSLWPFDLFHTWQNEYKRRTTRITLDSIYLYLANAEMIELFKSKQMSLVFLAGLNILIFSFLFCAETS